MFKNEISFISDLNLNKLQVVGDIFTIEDLKSSKIHPAILHFINASIDKEIFNDRKRIENNSIFDYKSDRINNYFVLISEEVKRTQHFDLKYLKQVVQNAIFFNINFLTTPNNTLSKFIFGDSEIKTIEEIVLGISHAYYYRYLQKILLTYLDKKKVLSLTREEFSQLLERVDIISRETHLIDTLTTAINSMTNFFDQNSRTTEKLPLKAIQLYLDEKKLSEFSLKLESNFVTEASTLYLGNDILNVLRSVTPESDIILEETKRVEDELIEDNADFINTTDPEHQVDDEINLNEDKTHFSGEDIFEVSENEIDIPNNEILSSDELIIEENKLEADEDKHPNNKIKLDENFEEISEIDHDASEELSSNSENQNVEEPQKKKTDGIKLLSKIIDLSPLYNSLVTELKPFENFERKLSLFKSLKNQSEDLNYQIDLTSINDKLENIGEDSIPKNKSIEKKDFEFLSMEITKKEDSKISEIVKSDYLEFSNNMDTMVNESDNDNEEEFLIAKETLEDLETNDDDENTIEKLDNNISFGEDEITEVFSDLTFLDSKESLPNIDTMELRNNNEDEKLSNIKDDLNITPSEKFNIDDDSEISFSSTLLPKDMSKIIELIFDYDMEEYYSIINKISFCDNEDAAMQILEDYCNNNHIELASKEVETFKSIISEFFTKTYS